MNQPIREALPTPTGWLVAPTRDCCLFFIRDPKSVMVAPTVFTQLWYCTEEGIPTKLKNTRRLDYESAHENRWEIYSKIVKIYRDILNQLPEEVSKKIAYLNAEKI